MSFRHLDYAPDAGVDELGPAAVDDLLERGDLAAWAPLARAIARDPWGPTAETVLGLCKAHDMYGTSPLWQAWIEHRRHRRSGDTTTLAEARSGMGLTQSQVAERLGISQADVSKLERRRDIRLSTLRAYAQAIGARLDVGLLVPGERAARSLAFPDAKLKRREP